MAVRCRRGDRLAIPVVAGSVAVAQVVEALGGNVLVAVYPATARSTATTPLTAAQARRLRTHTSFSPALVEHAVRAYHGHGPWLAAFDAMLA